MAVMFPDRIPGDAPESERVIFEILRNSPHPGAKHWTVFCGKFVDNPDNPVRPRELDFVIFMEDGLLLGHIPGGKGRTFPNRRRYAVAQCLFGSGCKSESA